MIRLCDSVAVRCVRGDEQVIAAVERVSGSLELGLEHAARFMYFSHHHAWEPLVLTVSSADTPVGIVFAGEPKTFGVPSGVVALYDLAEVQTVFAREPDISAVLHAALASLLQTPRYHTIYLRRSLSCSGTTAEILKQLPSQSGAPRVTAFSHTLILPRSFDDFLRSLGPHVRRNHRYCTRRAVESRMRFVAGLTGSEVTQAILSIGNHQRTSQFSVRELKSLRVFLDRVPGSIWCGLVTGAGQWVALVGGWIQQDRFVLCRQLNHGGSAYAKLSLSTVLRSFLIEELIARGVRRIDFLGGCRGQLERYCSAEYGHVFIAEKKTIPATIVRTVGRVILKLRNLASNEHRGA